MSAGNERATERRVLEPAPMDPAADFFDFVMEAARGPPAPQSGARILLGGAMGMERPSATLRTDEDVMNWAQRAPDAGAQDLRNELLAYYTRLLRDHPGVPIQAMDEGPEFGPARVKLIAFLDGRQTHSVAEHLLDSAKRGSSARPPYARGRPRPRVWNKPRATRRLH